MSTKVFRYLGLAAIAILAVSIMVWTSLDARRPVSQATPPATVTPAPSMIPESTEGSAIDIAACGRPYPSTSVWNVPLDWSVAKIHPESDLMLRAFFESREWIGSDTSQYTPNMYWASNDTPLVPIRLLENRFRDALSDQQLRYGVPGGTVWIPLPSEAVPAVGTDGQLLVINVDTGEEWGLNEGFIDTNGQWFASGIYRYHVDNSGIPPEGFGQRGAGIGQLAGIVRRCEVERGRIDHAVTLAYDYPCEPEVCRQNGWPAYLPPFRKTDGKGDSPYDMPEGTRIAIRPEITREEIEEACDGIKGCVVWALNMQEYGGFIVDRSGHPKTYAEGDATAQWDASLWTEDMLRDIPMDWYVVIDWNVPSTEAP
jgi:hypothetical protein